jgi:hypothetical protein
MKRVVFVAGTLAVAVSLSSCATRNAAPTGKTPAYSAADAPVISSTSPLPAFASSSWPLMFSSGTNTYTIFEPQSDSWNGHELTARSAVSVRLSDSGQPVYGTISFKAITLVDKTKQTAALAQVKVEGADFPSAHGQTPEYLAVLRRELPKRAQPLPLEHLQSSFTTTELAAKAQPLNNTPPKVIIATRPAVLVSVDGPPVWKEVQGTRLLRAINTRMLLLKDDDAGKCYLHLFDGYLEATSLSGPWSLATRPPAGSDVAEKASTDSGQADLMEGEPDSNTQRMPSLSSGAPPDVFVSTTPTELITFSGQPQYAPISGTELVYAANTTANVFKLLNDQQNYILISGRWYSASSLDGPWRFVPGDKLPHDFANIPDASPKENVKASVPGTRQAGEALVANSIPQGSAVSRDTKMEDPQIDGPPQLAPIQDTLLHYVVNSSTPIIEVSPDAWFACQNGVWYVSKSVDGPWTVATYVPPAIYTIPTSSPLHYVTYVRVYGNSSDEVYAGYTPGYLGTEVSSDGTVVYGTGYDYPPWIGTYWYCAPVTWGYGYDYCWTPWWGWGYDCGFGWGCGGWGFVWWDFCPPFPFFCGFGHHHHDHDGFHRVGTSGGFARGNTGANLYRHNGPFNSAGRSGQFVRLSDYGRAYNSRTGQLAGGGSARVQNVSGAAWDPMRGGGIERGNGYRPSTGGNYVRGQGTGGLFGENRGFNGGFNGGPARGGGFSRGPGGSYRGGGGHESGGGGSHSGGGGGGGGHSGGGGSSGGGGGGGHSGGGGGGGGGGSSGGGGGGGHGGK